MINQTKQAKAIQNKIDLSQKTNPLKKQKKKKPERSP